MLLAATRHQKKDSDAQDNQRKQNQCQSATDHGRLREEKANTKRETQKHPHERARLQLTLEGFDKKQKTRKKQKHSHDNAHLQLTIEASRQKKKKHTQG